MIAIKDRRRVERSLPVSRRVSKSEQPGYLLARYGSSRSGLALFLRKVRFRHHGLEIDSRFPLREMPVLRFKVRNCRSRLITALAFLLFLSMAFARSDRTGEIRRLDGSHISFGEAEAFARKTLAEAHVTGAEMAVLDRGKLVWSGAFGLRQKNPDRPMTLDTTTWAASITKSVFTTYVMTLVERGEFDLDTPVARQLPQPLDTYEPYKVTASEIVKDPAWQRLTPRMLLSHSSGLAISLL